MDLAGLQVSPGRTFRWAGQYGYDLNEARTLDTQLNVFAEFRPRLAEDLRRLGHEVLVAVRDPRRVDLELARRMDAMACASDRLLIQNIAGWSPRLLVATFWPTAYLAAQCHFAGNGTALPVYFAQDYEVDFYPPEWKALRDAVARTYAAMPWCFCKTPWLADRLREAGARVSMVPPALDLDCFAPAPAPTAGCPPPPAPAHPLTGTNRRKSHPACYCCRHTTLKTPRGLPWLPEIRTRLPQGFGLSRFPWQRYRYTAALPTPATQVSAR